MPPFISNIYIIDPKTRKIIHDFYNHCTGSMDNAKRHASRIARQKELTPLRRNWNTKRTKYAPNSGMYGSWESKATRPYKTKDGKEVHIEIHRA